MREEDIVVVGVYELDEVTGPVVVVELVAVH